MRRIILSAAVVLVALAGAAALLFSSTPAARAADGGAAMYRIDPAHASVAFEVMHMDINRIYGLFTDTQGTFTLDKSTPANSQFDITTKAASVVTGQPDRDNHLRSPTFFDVKEFPNITFKSTKVAAGMESGAYEVTGDLTIHGVTKSITITVKNLGDAEFPPKSGKTHTGIVTDFNIKRSDYGMKNLIPMVSDDVKLMIGIEGAKQ